jgi:two-component system response regulator YesN
MIKLLIAEDEYIERKALVFLIGKYFRTEIEIVAEVSDGRDALERALKLNPDVILMDIQMPQMDGLEAAEAIKKQLPAVEIVIMTAFSYFEYARNAIRLGVGDYLVKPFSNEEFCASLNKIIKKIASRRLELERQRSNLESLKNIRLLVEREMIFELVQGESLDERQLSQYTSFFNIRNRAFRCLIFQGHTDSEPDETVIGYIKGKLKQFFSEVIGYHYFNSIIFLIFDANLQSETKSEAVPLVISDIEHYLQTLMNGEVQTGLSEIGREPEKISQAYFQAKQALKMRQARTEKNCAGFNEKAIAICEKIITEDYHGAFNQYQNLMTEMGIFQNGNGLKAAKEYLKQLSTVVNHNINRFFNNKIILAETNSVHQAIERIHQMDELELYAANFIKETVESISLHKESRDQKMVNMVKDYIKQKYTKDIGLNEVADYIGFSPFYLSKWFKKLEGMSFKDYLIQIRIEKAKHLIRETRKTIQEVAYEVGYTDPSYFSKAFKKVVGISPKEFADR